MIRNSSGRFGKETQQFKKKGKKTKPKESCEEETEEVFENPVVENPFLFFQYLQSFIFPLFNISNLFYFLSDDISNKRKEGKTDDGMQIEIDN